MGIISTCTDFTGSCPPATEEFTGSDKFLSHPPREGGKEFLPTPENKTMKTELETAGEEKS